MRFTSGLAAKSTDEEDEDWEEVGCDDSFDDGAREEDDDDFGDDADSDGFKDGGDGDRSLIFFFLLSGFFVIWLSLSWLLVFWLSVFGFFVLLPWPSQPPPAPFFLLFSLPAAAFSVVISTGCQVFPLLPS